MTHDELIAKIENKLSGCNKLDCQCYEDDKPWLILRVVVELHKSEHSIAGYRCTHCTLEVTYPCPTIRAIEKELE